MKGKSKNIIKRLSLVILVAALIAVGTICTKAIVTDYGTYISLSGIKDEDRDIGIPNSEGYYCVNFGAFIAYMGDYNPYTKIADYEFDPDNHTNAIAEAYALSNNGYGVHTKQIALWKLIPGSNYSPNKPVEVGLEAEANSLVDESRNYALFYEKIQANNKITINDSRAKTTTQGSNYVIGPFLVDYVGDNSNFGTVSKASLQDNNGNQIYQLDTSIVKDREDFYITVPKANVNTSQVKLHIEYTYKNIINGISASCYQYSGSKTATMWQQLIKPNVGLQDTSINATSNPVKVVMQLSGYAFEDKATGKTGSIDGVMQDTERIPGVRVTLCSKESGNITATTTDNLGYYEFKDIQIGPNYYVKFTYNGQNYQHTIYNSTKNGNTDRSRRSYSTENNSERDAFNNQFKEISENMVVKGATVSNQANNLSVTQLGTNDAYAINAYSGNQTIAYYTSTTANVNLGVTKRETADLAIRKDVYKATLSIKGYTQEYVYNKRELDATGVWDISARASDIYYSNSYIREVRPSDYNYTGNNKLSAIVTYKIVVKNQSAGLNCRVPAIYDWYDEEYTFLDASIGNTKLTTEGSKTISGYNGVKIILPNTVNQLGIAEQLTIIVNVKVNAGANGESIALDNDRGKGNVTEIASYQTYYATNSSPNGNEYSAGDVAGRIDVDSNPGNATSAEEKTFEDDTDRAPYIKFKLSTNDRLINGYTWEDLRNTTVDKANVGDGIMQNNEPKLAGVTVELWERNNGTDSLAKIWNGTKWIEAITVTSSENGKKGQYSFSGALPGNYYVKFIYPDGQKYKSTIYNYTKVNPTFSVNNPDVLGDYAETSERYSDVRDLYGDTNTQETRQYVNNLLQSETNETLATYNDRNKTNISMSAITGKISINIEKDPNNKLSDAGRLYELPNIDLGLQERAKAQLTLNKEVASVKLTLANGNVLFDSNPNSKVTNVMWATKQSHTTGYTGNLMNQPTVRTNNQQILLTMDKELMQGANINISYNIKVKNIGEVDYDSKEFYYLGAKTGNIVKTKINTIIDYPGAALSDDDKATRNNLQFDASTNTGWSIVTKEELAKLVDSKLTTDINNVKAPINGYSTIVKYDFNKELEPAISNDINSTTSTTLSLSQVMTTDSSSDNLSYNNLAEIVSVSNILGRKMEYSTVGNQNPDTRVSEVDTDSSQTVTILPPFGQKYIYYALTAVLAIVLGTGIVIIKKRVLKKTK